MQSSVHRRPRGFTLLELLVVVAIIALGTAAVSLSMRDSAQDQLEREAMRLSALLESARVQSRASGAPVHWQVVADGFQFDGLSAYPTTQSWLNSDTRVVDAQPLTLGPEPMIEPQAVQLSLHSQPDKRLWITTDGLRPFNVNNVGPAAAGSP